MGLNIKNARVEKLAAEVAKLAGESKTEAIGKALQERKERLVVALGADQLGTWKKFLETEVWPLIPPGATIPSKSERESILGYGPDGV